MEPLLFPCNPIIRRNLEQYMKQGKKYEQKKRNRMYEGLHSTRWNLSKPAKKPMC